MNKANFRPVGSLRYIVDFSAYTPVWNQERGFCFKASTADGLVIINVASGHRIDVPSTEMFFLALLIDRRDPLAKENNV